MLSYHQTATSTHTQNTESYISNPGGNHYGSDEERCKQIAKRVNKQFNGQTYCLITDPKSFTEPYKRRIEAGLQFSNPEDCELACSCNYDLTEVDQPKINSEGKLVFYVHRNSKELPVPYRVICDNPAAPHNATITQVLLPFIKLSE